LRPQAFATELLAVFLLIVLCLCPVAIGEGSRVVDGGRECEARDAGLHAVHEITGGGDYTGSIPIY